MDPNAEEIVYWSEEAGPRWVAQNERLDAQLGPIGSAALERARIAEGERVLDVGCGCGGSTFEIAQSIGSDGFVQGVDVSDVMLERARARAGKAGLGNVGFLRADAQVHAFEEPAFDCAFSRFGVMFFTDPVAAFSNIRRALSSDGRLTFACWASLEENPWVAIPLSAAGKHAELPEQKGESGPGPFSLARRERILEILRAAGFEAASCERHDGELLVGGPGSFDDVIEFMKHVGPAAIALAGATPGARKAAIGEIRRAIEPYLGADGVRMAFRAWIVTATRRAKR